MDTLAYILDKYKLQPKRMPCEIPNMGRDNLPELFKELGFRVGIEIGVYRGIYSEILCKGIPGLKLYGVDPWKVYKPDYRDFSKQIYLTNAHKEAKERLKKYDVELIWGYSMDAVKNFDDNSLDFVYIDGNHEFPYVTQDIIHWTKKVRPGGIVSGHDYLERAGKRNTLHVIAAINGYTHCYRIYPWFVIGTKAMTPGVIRDRSRSWMFVKE